MYAQRLITIGIILALCIAVPVHAQNDHRTYTAASLNDVTESLVMMLENSQDRRLWGDYSSEKIDLTFDGKPGMTIRIDHRFGDIDVVKGANDKVKITGEKRVSARDKDIEKEFLDEMRLIVEERAGGLEIIAEYPEQHERDRRFRKRIKNFGIMYTIEIPEKIDLEMENSFGGITLRSVSGTFNVRNGFGVLSADDLDGEIFLKNQFGALEAQDLKGNAEITNEHGELTIRTVSGSLEADNQFGEIRVEDIENSVEINGAHGSMIVKRIKGDAILTNSFGNISCSDVTGRVEIENNNARVEVFNAGKDVDIRNSFGRIKVVEIGGNLFIKNNNSAVQVEDIPGNVEISNSFGSVDIDGAGGDVIVTNRNGSINVMDILRDASNAKTVRLETSFASIEVELPANVSARIDASTTFGNIRTDFPVMLEKSSINSQRISAKLGDALHTIELESTNASIRVIKR